MLLQLSIFFLYKDEDELHCFHSILSENIAIDEFSYKTFWNHLLQQPFSFFNSRARYKIFFSIRVMFYIILSKPVLHCQFFWNTVGAISCTFILERFSSWPFD